MLTLVVLAFIGGVYVGARFAHHPWVLWLIEKMRRAWDTLRTFAAWVGSWR